MVVEAKQSINAIYIERLLADPFLPGIERIFGQDELDIAAEIVQRLRDPVYNAWVGMTTGSYDIVHPGHAWYIAELGKETAISANLRGRAPFVVVGVNSDQSTRSNKGGRTNNRPVFGEVDRALVVSAMKGVNMVFIFDDNNQLKKFQPDIFQVSIGSDHKVEDRPEVKHFLENFDTRVLVLDPTYPNSTSGILSRIHKENIW